MKRQFLTTLKAAAIILTLLLALIGILYVTDLVTGAVAREVFEKLVAIVAILTGTAFVVVLLTKGSCETRTDKIDSGKQD